MPDSAIIVLIDAGRLKSARAMDMPAVAAKYSSSSSTMSIVTLGAGGAVVLPGQVISSVGAIYWPNELGPTDGTENAEVLNAAYELIQSTGIAALAVLPLIDWADFPSLYGELQQIDGVRILDHPLTIGGPAKPQHTTTPVASSTQTQPFPIIHLAAKPVPPKTATARTATTAAPAKRTAPAKPAVKDGVTASVRHIFVAIEGDAATPVDWTTLRESVTAAGDYLSVGLIDGTDSEWVVRTATGAIIPLQLPPSSTGQALPGIGAAIIDQVVEAQVLIPAIRATEIRLHGGKLAESELFAGIQDDPSISLRVAVAGGGLRPGSAGAQPKTPASRGSKPTYLPMRPNPNSAAGRAAATTAIVAGAPPAPTPAIVGPVAASRIKSPSPGTAATTPGGTKSTAAKTSASTKKPARSTRKKIVAGVVVVLVIGAIVGWWSGTVFTVAGTAQVAGVGDCWNASRYELVKSGKDSVPAKVACTSDEAHVQVVDDAAECGADCTVVTVASTSVRVRTIPRSGDCLFAFINTMFPSGTSQASGWLSELTPCAISVEPESWMSKDIDNVSTALGVDQSALVLTRVEIATVSQTEVACPAGQISWEWDFTDPSLWLCTGEASTP